jgi:hypothetical protein
MCVMCGLSLQNVFKICCAAVTKIVPQLQTHIGEIGSVRGTRIGYREGLMSATVLEYRKRYSDNAGA